MHSGLKATMATATLSLLVGLPASDNASARPRSCAHAGKEYSVQGTVVAGGTLAQVSGASTKKPNDDRYSGTLVVNVTQASRERDLGAATYVVTGIRLTGKAGKAMPTAGTKVKLYGTSLSASAARRCGVQEPTSGAGAVEDTADDAAPVVTGVQIRVVKVGRAGPVDSAGSSDDDSADDTTTGDDRSSDDSSDPAADDSPGVSVGASGDDSAAADDNAGSSDDSVDDDSTDDGSDAAQAAPAPSTAPAPAPAPTTPAATTPASAPIVGLPGGLHKRR